MILIAKKGLRYNRETGNGLSVFTATNDTDNQIVLNSAMVLDRVEYHVTGVETVIAASNRVCQYRPRIYLLSNNGAGGVFPSSIFGVEVESQSLDNGGTAFVSDIYTFDVYCYFKEI